MIIVLKQHAPDEKVKAFCNELQTMGYQINDSMGSDTHILGLIGDTKALSESWVLANPVVETCRRVSEPYKKANRKFHPDDTVVEVGDKKIKVGGGHFAVMAGPCSVEIYLSCWGRECFKITCHCCSKNKFSRSFFFGTKRLALKNCSVFKD